MMKIKYSTLASMEFTRAMQELNSAKVEAKLSYDLQKITEKLTKAQKEINKEYQDTIVNVYAQKDEKGEVKFGKQGVEICEGKKEEFQKAVEAFGDKEVEIDRNPITLGRLAQSGVKLSAAQMGQLTSIIVEDEMPVKPFSVVKNAPETA